MQPEPLDLNTTLAQDVVEAVGKASEALEYVERARGHLYSFHQLMGRADIEFGKASEMLDAAGLQSDSRAIEGEIVGRNVLTGRWTFQIVDEFDDQYYEVARDIVRELESKHCDNRRHELERRMKEDRRTQGRSGHERIPQ